MIKATPELEAKIKASGKPIIELSAKQFAALMSTAQVVKNYKPKPNTNNTKI